MQLFFLLFLLFVLSLAFFIFIIYFFGTTDISTFVREGHWEMNINFYGDGPTKFNCGLYSKR